MNDKEHKRLKRLKKLREEREYEQQKKVMSIEEQREQAVDLIKTTPMGPCLLCDGEPTYRGVFFPNEEFARQLNVPINKNRLILYSLCEACKADPDCSEKCDQVFMRRRPDHLINLGSPPVMAHELN